MAGIENVQQIVAAIRSEMASRISQKGTTARSAKRTIKGSASSQQRMGSLINQRVKGLQPDDPERGRKAFRIFLESILLTEFGDDLINDHHFYQMVDAVQQNMEQDPHISDAMAKAVFMLLDQQQARR